jgi:hypothetical protein
MRNCPINPDLWPPEFLWAPVADRTHLFGLPGKQHYFWGSNKLQRLAWHLE